MKTKILFSNATKDVMSEEKKEEALKELNKRGKKKISIEQIEDKCIEMNEDNWLSFCDLLEKVINKKHLVIGTINRYYGSRDIGKVVEDYDTLINMLTNCDSIKFYTYGENFYMEGKTEYGVDFYEIRELKEEGIKLLEDPNKPLMVIDLYNKLAEPKYSTTPKIALA